MLTATLPLGKLPADLLDHLLARAPVTDPRVVLPPGIGLDCAVVDPGAGPSLWVYKSDPITFAADEIGWYAVQVNANDIATTGAAPRWLLSTVLLPEGRATPGSADLIFDQLYRACQELGVSVIGGHTEVTAGLQRPIVMGTMIGEVDRDRLITPRGARPGDHVLLTKGVPIEATAILAREFPGRLRAALTEAEIHQARGFLFDPGISIVRDARAAIQAGTVTAMHDPTEGGLSSALWELSQACGHALSFEPSAVPVPPLAARVCRALGLDPLAAIASGALLLTCPAAGSAHIQGALRAQGIAVAEIGVVEAGPVGVWHQTPDGRQLWPRPARDEIARVYAEPQP